MARGLGRSLYLGDRKVWGWEDSQLHMSFEFGWLQTRGNRKASCTKINDKLLHAPPWLLN